MTSLSRTSARRAGQGRASLLPGSTESVTAAESAPGHGCQKACGPSQPERDARSADGAETWPTKPLRMSLHDELLSAVRSRRAVSCGW